MMYKEEKDFTFIIRSSLFIEVHKVTITLSTIDNNVKALVIDVSCVVTV